MKIIAFEKVKFFQLLIVFLLTAMSFQSVDGKELKNEGKATIMLKVFPLGGGLEIDHELGLGEYADMNFEVDSAIYIGTASFSFFYKKHFGWSFYGQGSRLISLQ